MRYGIFGDVHSNIEAFEAVIGAYKKEKIDKYICVGDVVGYGVNPEECIDKIISLGAFVCAGNHDWAAVNLLSLDYFNPDAAAAIAWTRKNLNTRHKGFLESLKLVYKNDDLTVVHATLDHPAEFNYLTEAYMAEETFLSMETKICFVGHTHIPGIFRKGADERIYYHQDRQIFLSKENKYIVNVGSIGQPRDNNLHSCYCIFDTTEAEIEIKRMPYDAKKTRNKIIGQGLPVFLGERLLEGK